MAISKSATEPRPIERILDLLPDAKPYTRGYLACCPAHGDRSPSLMIWEDEDGHVGLKCFTGCTRKQIVEAMDITESDLYLSDGEKPAGQKRKVIDVCDLGIDKGIHPNDLVRLGLRNGECTYTKKKGRPCEPYDVKGVVIPYFNADGSEYARYRLRAALSGSSKNLWNEDSQKNPIIPYGLHRLKDAREKKYLIIPEGESDCWTLWLHGFPALGIPGVEMTRVLLKAHLEGIEQLYIIQEPPSESDKENGRDPGKKFVANLEKRLKEIGYKGRSYVINFEEETGVKDPNELHQVDIKGFKQAFDTVMLRARPLGADSEKQRTVGRSLKDLMAKELPPVKWAVPDIIPEGLNLLCGKPKLGKSWLALHIALAIAYGGKALSDKQVEQGQVLYLALEDNERRMQSRVRKLLGDEAVPDDFDYDIECPRLDQGGYELLESWIRSHPRARLIVIDTWVKISPRPQGGRQRTQYEDDYDSLSLIKKLSDRYNVAILAVHHLRKTSSEEDFLDEVSGSVGVAGTVDGIIGLKRERGQFDASLHVTGRDIEDDTTLALSFDHDSALWKLQGKAEEVAKTKERQAIVDLLKEYPDGLNAREIADLLERNYNTLRNILTRMSKAGELCKDGSKYIFDASVVNRSQRSQQTRETASEANSQKAKLTTAVGATVVNRSQSSSSTTKIDYAIAYTNDYDDYGNPRNDYGSAEIDYGTDYGANPVDEPVEPDEEKIDYADYANGKIITLHTTVVRCETRFDNQMCEAHQPGQALTTDVVGNSWCEHCDDHRKLMDLGHAKGWLALILDAHGGKVKLQAGQDRYFKFARTYGHHLVSVAVAHLEKM